LHTHKIIHRDIKCENIFIFANNTVKVLINLVVDLGVSKILRNHAICMATKVGTPLYLSPEMIQQIPYDYKVF